jgi:hypothetical protein
MDWELGLRCRSAGLTASFDRELDAVHHQRRDLAGFLRDRRRSAEDRIRVHELYRSQLGPLPLTHFTQDCSPLTRWVITRGWMPLAQTVRISLTLVLRVAIGLRLRTCERRCALDATSLEGALAVLRRDRRRGANHED